MYFEIFAFTEGDFANSSCVARVDSASLADAIKVYREFESPDCIVQNASHMDEDVADGVVVWPQEHPDYQKEQ